MNDIFKNPNLPANGTTNAWLNATTFRFKKTFVDGASGVAVF
jgi:hypothetical protein